MKPKVLSRYTLGFTLIELLIVVAIIAILSAIALVNFRLASDRALSALCKSRLRTIDYGLKAYLIENNRYPPGDGVAGDEPTPGRTQFGNGPAANGSWDGVSLLIVKGGYVTDPRTLFCPVYERRRKGRLQNFRYAYNNSALDTGGPLGGANNIDRDSGDIWLVRCLWVPGDRSLRPSDEVKFPHGQERDEENILFTNGRVEQQKGRVKYDARFPPR